MLSFLLYALLTNFSFAAPITGAGPSSLEAFYSRWSTEFKESGYKIELVFRIQDGAQDSTYGFLLLPQRMTKSASRSVQIPVALSAVTVVYNVPDLKAPIKLDDKILAKIYKGEVQDWDHRDIRALNPELSLPHLKIIVCYPIDPVEGVNTFNQYINKPEKSEESWSLGLAAKNHAAMLGLIRKNTGAIGFIDYPTATINQLSVASLKNAKNKYVVPTPESIAVAAQKNRLEKMIQSDRVQELEAEAYPLTHFIYFVPGRLNKGQKDSVAAFMKWGLEEGQNFLSQMHYVPLPQSLRSASQQMLTSWLSEKQSNAEFE